LHELPSRSPNYDPEVFWATILKNLPNNIVVIREPCKPVGWADSSTFVRIKIPGVPADELTSICKLIQGNLPKVLAHEAADPLIFSEPIGLGEFVKMEKALAVECIHKILRTEGLEHFRYELGEVLTSFDANRIAPIIGEYLEAPIVVHYINTSGFEKAWLDSGIEVKLHEGVRLRQIPTTHCIIRGSRITARASATIQPRVAAGTVEADNPNAHVDKKLSVEKRVTPQTNAEPADLAKSDMARVAATELRNLLSELAKQLKMLLLEGDLNMLNIELLDNVVRQADDCINNHFKKGFAHQAGQTRYLMQILNNLTVQINRSNEVCHLWADYPDLYSKPEFEQQFADISEILLGIARKALQTTKIVVGVLDAES
jgi:hypothetical protein